MLDFEYTLRVKLRQNKQVPFFGPGITELLARVEQTGSLQMAAASMKMSYSKAWKITRTAEKTLGFTLLERRAGGAGGGFSRLTDQGKAFLAQYNDFCAELEKKADRLFLEYFGDDFDRTLQKLQHSDLDSVTK